MKIVIETIPFEAMRYPSAGDYWEEKDGTRRIVVAELGDDRMNFLIALHELFEQQACLTKGISEKKITAFDKKFEKERERGLHKPEDEPGDDKRCIYRIQHSQATFIEKFAAFAIGVDWKKFSKKVMSL